MTTPFERPSAASLPPMPRSFKRVLLGFVAAAFLVMIVLPWLASFFTDWLWFSEIGFQSVFIRSLVWRVVLFFVGGLVAFAYLYGNVRIARGRGTAFPVLYVNRGDGVNIDVSRMFTRLFLPAALFIAFITAISTSSLWMTLLKGMNGVAVGERDPLFGRDVSFYLFRLPAISAVLSALITLTFLSMVGTAAMYALRSDITL